VRVSGRPDASPADVYKKVDVFIFGSFMFIA
jgi:hypothetical protein